MEEKRANAKAKAKKVWRVVDAAGEKQKVAQEVVAEVEVEVEVEVEAEADGWKRKRAVEKEEGELSSVEEGWREHLDVPSCYETRRLFRIRL